MQRAEASLRGGGEGGVGGRGCVFNSDDAKIRAKGTVAHYTVQTLQTDKARRHGRRIEIFLGRPFAKF